MAKTSVAIFLLCAIWRSLATTYSNIFCPPGYCVKRVKKGTNSSSFMCEYYQDQGYPCGWEGYECRGCVGLTNYGEMPLNSGYWSPWVMSNASASSPNTYAFTCSHGVGSPYGPTDPAPGHGKICWCKPYTLRPPNSSSDQSVTAECNMAPNQFVQPQCIISEVAVGISGMSTQQASSLMQGTLNPTAQQTLFADIAADPYYGTLRSSMITYDPNTLTASIVVPCSGSHGELDLDGCITKQDNFRTTPSLMYMPMRTSIAAHSSTLGITFASLAPSIEMHPAVSVVAMPAAPSTNCVPGITQAAATTPTTAVANTSTTMTTSSTSTTTTTTSTTSVAKMTVTMKHSQATSCSALTTDLNHNNNQKGIYFKVVLGSALTITALQYIATSAGTLQVWTRPGTYGAAVGSGWVLAVNATGQQAGNNIVMGALQLSAGSHMILLASSGRVKYKNGASVGIMHASNADLGIYSGYGTEDLIPGAGDGYAYSPRNFAGTIEYCRSYVSQVATTTTTNTSSTTSTTPTTSTTSVAKMTSTMKYSQAACTVPSTVGYNFVLATGTMTLSGFNPSGVACANGYVGAVTYAPCSSGGSPYLVSGCQAFIVVDGATQYTLQIGMQLFPHSGPTLGIVQGFSGSAYKVVDTGQTATGWGNINDGDSVEFNDVSVPVAGTYTMTQIWQKWESGQTRSKVYVNGTLQDTSVLECSTCQKTYWFGVESSVVLQQGVNSISFVFEAPNANQWVGDFWKFYLLQAVTATTLTATIQGSFNIGAPSATSAQVVLGATRALAKELQVPSSQVGVTVTPSRRLAQATPAFMRRLAGNWLVQYVATIPHSQVQASQIKFNTISLNSSAFSASLQKELIDAGVNSTALANFGITNFVVSLLSQACTIPAVVQYYSCPTTSGFLYVVGSLATCAQICTARGLTCAEWQADVSSCVCTGDIAVVSDSALRYAAVCPTGLQATTVTTTTTSQDNATGWILSGWSSCSESCGNGTRNRTIQCPSGICFGFASSHLANAILSDACSDYSGCGQPQQQSSDKSFTCPLGSSSLTCIAQLILFFVAAPAFILLCLLCLICIVYLRRRARPLRKGTVHIKDVGPVNFQVFHPNEGPESNSIVETKSKQEFQQHVDENGKIHTVWALNNKTVEAYLQKFSQQNKDVSDSSSDMVSTTLIRSAKAGDKKLEVVSSNDFQAGQNVTIDADTSTGEDNKIAGFGDRACILLANPLRYEHASGAMISKKVHNNKQLLAIGNESPRDFVFDSCFRGAASSNQGAAGSGVCVGLDGDELRTSFQTMYYDGCEVEYFSLTHKMWLPGKVNVNTKKVQDWSDSKMYAVTYDVTLQGGNYQEKVQVPLERLRAPLKVAELVDVYSLRDGGRWLTGVIHGTQSAAPAITGYQISLVGSNGILDKVPANRLRRRFPSGVAVSVYDGCTRGWCEATVMQNASTQMDLDVLEFEPTPVDALDTPWASLLVKFDKSGETKTVPSYLILTRSHNYVVRSAAGLPISASGVNPSLNPNSKQRPSPGPASEGTSVTDLWNSQLYMDEEEPGELTQPQAAYTCTTNEM